MSWKLNIKQPEIHFEMVTATQEQIDVLFNLLQSRVHKISYQDTNHQAHSKFVSEHPYRLWFLVKVNNDYVGSFYITKENTIGINVTDESTQIAVKEIIKFVNDNHAPLPAMPSVRARQYSINVPPTNEILAQTLKVLGADIAQISYYLP